MMQMFYKLSCYLYITLMVLTLILLLQITYFQSPLKNCKIGKLQYMNHRYLTHCIINDYTNDWLLDKNTAYTLMASSRYLTDTAEGQSTGGKKWIPGGRRCLEITQIPLFKHSCTQKVEASGSQHVLLTIT